MSHPTYPQDRSPDEPLPLTARCVSARANELRKPMAGLTAQESIVGQRAEGYTLESGLGGLLGLQDRVVQRP